MNKSTARCLSRASKALAAGALFVASPLTSCGLMAANAYLGRRMAMELEGGRRTLAMLGANAAMCVAAGAVSVAFSSVPVALAAAGALTWMFRGKGGDEGRQEDGDRRSREDPQVIDVEFEPHRPKALLADSSETLVKAPDLS